MFTFMMKRVVVTIDDKPYEVPEWVSVDELLCTAQGWVRMDNSQSCVMFARDNIREHDRTLTTSEVVRVQKGDAFWIIPKGYA